MAEVNIKIKSQTPDQKMSQLWTKLREDILCGRLAPSTRLPTVRQLGKQYSVAPATVSTAMTRLAHEGLVVRTRGSGSFVAEKLPVEQKILDFIRMRRPPDRGVKQGTLDWIEWLTKAAQEADRIPHWHHLTYEEVEEIEPIVERLSNSRGIVIYNQIPAELPSLLCQRGVPLVTLDSAYSGPVATRYPQISSFDRREASRKATEYLIGLGYSRIGFVRIYGPSREAGFFDAVIQHGLPMHADWFLDLGSDINHVNDERHQSCVRLCTRLLKSDNRPEAMVCPTIHIAHVLELTALKMGLRVPEDLAIVKAGTKSRSIFGRVPVAITSVGPSVEQTCRKTLDVLEQVVSKPFPQKHGLHEPIIMPVHLHVKDSCGARLKGVDTKEIGGENSKERRLYARMRP